MTQSYTYKFEGLRWIWPDGTRSYQPPPQVTEQFRAYGRHYNKRIEIIRESRDEYRKARTLLVPELAAAEISYAEAQDAVEKLRNEVKALRKEARRRAEGTELRSRLTIAVQARKSAGTVLKEAKAKAMTDTSLEAESLEINIRRNTKEKAARAATPAYWGTYLMAEDASSRAGRSKTDPQFRRWSFGLPTT